MESETRDAKERLFADSLARAYETGPVAPLSESADDRSAAAAYRIQHLNTARWVEEGRRLVGRKIGLTSKPVQEQFGVDQPDYGMLFADMSFCDGEEIPLDRFIQPKLEAEIAFVLDRDLDAPDLTAGDLLRAVDFAVAALEIVDSRIADWKISLFDTIADNASSGAYVLGTRPVRLSALDLVNCKMSLTVDGEEISSGRGGACLGNPLRAALWLVRVMQSLGSPPRAGDVILSGALGPMTPVRPEAAYQARIEGLGEVRAFFCRKQGGMQ